MRNPYPMSKIELPLVIAELLAMGAVTLAQRSSHAFRLYLRAGAGGTLRPGQETPLWNELRKQLRPHLRKRGAQVRLARLLGLPRQRINAFMTGGTQMPDAERTLQMLVWLIMLRDGRDPS